MHFDFDFYRSLSEAFGPTGFEDEVRDLIIDFIRPHVDQLKIDGIGNLIAIKGNPEACLITAHMDEVGFMITEIPDNGTLRFRPVGGVDPEKLPSKTVYVGKMRLPAVIGAKPIHLTKGSKQPTVTFSDLYLDLGFQNAAEAQNLVSVGDWATFTTPCCMQRETLFGKAHDNRIGCYILAQIIKEGLLTDGTFVFTVQEECGLRGAATILGLNRFKFGIALDTTTANDLPGVPLHKTVCQLGKGPVISFADGATLYRRDTVRAIFEHLKACNIPAQTKTKRTGGNEASAIDKIGFGSEAISVSTPCRYIHGPIGLFCVKDMIDTLLAVVEIVKFLTCEVEANGTFR
ncbi:MAG: M42 family peptidase [Clostridia bacterium]|nr:M42 family peptidase [Clostridia bacterium]